MHMSMLTQRCCILSTHMVHVVAPPIDPRLLDATAALLDRSGLPAVTLSAVAEEAGVSRVTLHRRGTTVEALVIAVLRRASDDLREEVIAKRLVVPATRGVSRSLGEIPDLPAPTGTDKEF